MSDCKENRLYDGTTNLEALKMLFYNSNLFGQNNAEFYDNYIFCKLWH